MNNTDELRALSEKYDMQPDHFHKDPRGFVIMTRRGVEHLQAKIKATVRFSTVAEYSDPKEGRYCIKAYAKCEIGQVETFGESSKANNRNAYPIAMAEKRALSRAILKLAGFYTAGVYGEDEIDE